MTETKPQPRERRVVSNDEYRRALEGTPGDQDSQKVASDNRNIIKTVLRQYEKQIPADTLNDCGLDALWRALSYHDPSYKQKFTTSLYRFLHWECRRVLRRLKGRGKSDRRLMFVPFRQEGDTSVVPDKHSTNFTQDDRYGMYVEDMEHVMVCMDKLPLEQRRLIQQYFFGDGMTYDAIGRTNGYSKETARMKVLRALADLKQISEACLGDAV